MMAEHLPDPIGVALLFADILDRLEIPYLVGGSLASSVHGEPRSTNDIDILADLRQRHVEAFVDALRPDYYVSEVAIGEALRTGGSFNVIHIAAAVKVDVFIAGGDRFNLERLRHRQFVELSSERDAALAVDTAEHSLLRKLEWYRRGGEVSERQWRDVVAILRIQAGRLDRSRLSLWASYLGVTDLLAEAMEEARGR